MRTTERKMVEAVKEKKSLRIGNTVVKSTGTVSSVTLFGNRIATFDFTAGILSLTVTEPDWKTATTKSRLNALLVGFVGTAIHQKKGKWYIGDRPFTGRENFSLFGYGC